jgi:hypothetical protein
MRWRVLCLLVLLTLWSSACGVLLTNGPPANHDQLIDFRCTQSFTAPILDALLGAANLVAGFVLASDPEAYGYPAKARGNLIAAGVVEAAILGASSAIGVDKVKRCRAAMDQLAVRQARLRAIAAPPGTPVEHIRVGPTVDTIVVGGMVQLHALALGAGRVVVPQPIFGWSSSDNAVAWVTRTGLVTALAPGTVTIDASAEDAVGSATVVVKPR